MIAVARTADLVIMVLDACKKDIHKEILTQEMESVGIRLNQKRPDIYFKEKKGGGLSFNSTVPLTHMDEKAVRLILHEYKIHNAEVLFREDATADQFIDAILGTRIYMKCIYVYNKIDQISLEEVDRLARGEHNVVISCNMKLNLDYLVEVLWEELKLIRIYTKKPGHPPDFDDGIIFRSGITVKNVCDGIHRFGKLSSFDSPQSIKHLQEVETVLILNFDQNFGRGLQVCFGVGPEHQVQPSEGGPDP